MRKDLSTWVFFGINGAKVLKNCASNSSIELSTSKICLRFFDWTTKSFFCIPCLFSKNS